MNKIKNIKNIKAFSLIEVIISVFLISIGMITAVNLLSSGLNQSYDSRNQFIAVALAQEGIELVQNFRDSAKLSGNDPFVNLPSSDEDECVVDVSKNSIANGDCNKTSAQENLYLATAGAYQDYYWHGAGEGTRFKRKLLFNYDDVDSASAESVDAYSVVIWGTDFPPNITVGNPPAEDDCNVVSKCSFVKLTLTKW